MINRIDQFSFNQTALSLSNYHQELLASHIVSSTSPHYEVVSNSKRRRSNALALNRFC